MNRPTRNTIWGCGLCLILATAYSCKAKADPMPLVCRGDLTIIGHGTSRLGDTGAVLDLDRRTFTAPFYGTFPLIRVDDSSISFGDEKADVSTYGNLDRISGKMSMNLMPLAERRKVLAGQGARFTAFIEAMCIPAKKLF